MNDELYYMPAHEQSRLLRARHISPVDLVRASLERIERYDGLLRAWISVDPDRAMAEARRAEAEIARGDWRGPLHGLSFGVKDQMHAEGFATTLGTRVLDEHEMAPPCEATLVTRLRAAGAILIGKQNLHEFGKGGTIDFPYGQPRNPWHPAHTASSSSTGSGIAVAAGQCSFAIGEDTGGSVRGPASCNGVVGMRPTHGRVSRHGGVMHAYTSDTFGPLARTVRDTAIVLQEIAGHDRLDLLCSDRPVDDYSAALTEDLRGLRLAIVTEIAFGEAVDPEVRRAFEASVDVLREAGAVVEEISLPLVKWAVPLQMLTADADVAAQFLHTYLRDRYERFDLGTRTRLAASSLLPASVYSRAMRARRIVREQVLNATKEYDALLTPTNITPPKRIEETQERVDGETDVVSRLIERRIAHYPFSLSNVPALSVQMGYSAAGLPLALQIAAAPYREASILRIGHAYELRTSWASKHPDLERALELAA